MYLYLLLLRFRMVRNMIFPVLLLAMGAANALTCGDYRNAGGQAVGTELMLALVILIVATMGDRVIPGFTHGRFQQGTTRNRPRVNVAAMTLLVAALAADVIAAPSAVRAGLFCAAAVAHAVRYGPMPFKPRADGRPG